MSNDFQKSQVLEKGLWELVRPSLMERLLMMTLPVVNIFFLSRVSDSAAAGAGIVSPFILFPMLLYMCLTSGGGSVIGRLFGADKYEEGKAAAAALFAMVFVSGLFAAIAFYFGAQYINQMMGLPEEVKKHADVYLSIVSLAFLPVGLSAHFGTILLAYGRVQWNFVATAVKYVITIGINSVVVFGLFGSPQLGAKGVAFSMVISSTIAMLLLAFIIHVKLKIRIPYREGVRHLRTYGRSILHIAVPSSFEPIVSQLTVVVLNAMVAKLGADMIAAKVYVEGVFTMVMIVSTSFAGVTHMMIMHLLGRGDYDGVHAQLMSSTKFVLMGVGGVCLLLLLANEPIMRMFTSKPTILEATFVLFVISAIIEIPKTANMMISGSLRMAGDAWFVAHNVMIVTWLIMIPAAYVFVFVFEWGLIGIFMAALLDEVLRLVVNWKRWGVRKWISYAVNL